jgi:predicted secreted acid phosphatase
LIITTKKGKSMVMKNVICVVLVSAGALLNATPPPSLRVAKKQHSVTSAEYHNVVSALRAYYEQSTDGATAYERDLKVICDKALEHFKQLPVTANAAVVFDLDETLLSNYALADTTNFVWTVEDAYTFRQNSTCPAIKPVRELYAALKGLSFKIIFLTSRRDTLTQRTIDNLASQGMSYDELILLPIDLFNQGISHGAWKAATRAALSQRYTIVGNVGDSESDFEGEHNGYKVKLPNYLY